MKGTDGIWQAYRAQLGVVERRVADGDRAIGWKVSLTNPLVRSIARHGEPLGGYMLESLRFGNGSTIRRARFEIPQLEAELCFRIGRRLRGPGITRVTARESVEALIAAFEVVDPKIDDEQKILEDVPGLIVGNAAHCGFIAGDEAVPAGTFDPKALAVELKKNGETVQRAVSGERGVDDQFELLAWLANHLARHDLSLQPGQYVMTSSIIQPVRFAAGEYWEANFDGIGTVAVKID